MSIQTKDEADLATMRRWEEERKTFVPIRNRFGRVVEVSLFHAKQMVKNGEGELISSFAAPVAAPIAEPAQIEPEAAPEEAAPETSTATEEIL